MATEPDDLSDLTKDELQDMADDLGLPVSGTKAEIIERIEAAQNDEPDDADDAETVDESSAFSHAELREEDIVKEPAVVYTAVPTLQPTDDDSRLGGWVDIVSGDYAGRRGHYFDNVSVDDDGRPEQVLVRTRDADNLVLDLPYDDVRPSAYTGGR